MSESTLSFDSSKNFRDKLVVKNLPPYNLPGAYSSPTTNVNYETNLSDLAVIDSPNDLISQDPFADTLYPLNKFGPEGGYDKNINYNNVNVTPGSNDGPYQPTDTNMDLLNEFFIDAAYIQNIYGPEGGYSDMFIVTDIQNNNKLYLPYWDPPIFRPSSYSAYNILISNNPTGSDGTISQDSYLQRLSAQFLQGLLKDRAAIQDNTDTKLISDPTAFSTPSSVSNQLRGNIITPNNDYRVTLPPQTDTFLTRLQGVYVPSSPIPGDYFLDEQSTRNVNSIGQVVNIFAGRSTTLGDILGPAVSRVINPSIVFLENTGSGQKSALFTNLSYNRYKPQYGSSSLGGIATNLLLTGINAIINSTGTQLPGDFYVGSVISNPGNVESPVNEVPIDAFGRETGAIVYGPSELGLLYEGNDSQINFGLQARSTTDGGGIDGTFVWTSPKYKQNAGFKVGPGGNITSPDEEFNQISSDYNKNLSTNIDFKVGSILDETQRLIRSADSVRGEKRLRHVGNAINQTSKVFNDGYKEMTKGSKVLSYQNQNGVEQGVEYCRVFAKDTPYYNFSDLQKTDGNIRKFSYSVLDNTYNLNIAPLRGQNSTNISNGRVKKYMFSIENLAWKYSNRPDLKVSDLPVCEIGPNGGRVMWFPPYDLKFNESSTPSFNPTTFLGRPEPIYTYKDTSRSGTISWKMVVDHPSILNVIVDRALENEKNRARLNSIVDSFFAGCKKYDIYELAAKYNTIPSNSLIAYQEILSNPRLTREQLNSVNNSIPKENAGLANSDTITNNSPAQSDLKTYVGMGFFFSPDDPPIDNTGSYSVLYNTTISNIDGLGTAEGNQDRDKNISFKENVLINNYNSFISDLIPDLTQKLTNNKITILLTANNSKYENPVNSKEVLNTQRKNSIEKFFKEKIKEELLKNLTIKLDGTSTSITPVGNYPYGSLDCNQTFNDNELQVWSTTSIGCRSLVIKDINSIAIGETEKNVNDTPSQDINNLQQGLKPQPNTDPLDNLKKGLSKKVLRELLSECDYFDVIEQTNPMIYDSIKEKIKYFNPAFHSLTPEGLNSRLTFLQQCVRPGDTIPTVTQDGETRSDDAINTAFGAPPILVLRIGDFYNTKIVPTSLQITYEPLLFDINPEGIGVQPMLANITLGFNFIGGSGLARPIEQLQNALSFNYYANTEMYDERAEATEDTSKLDKQVFQSILDSQPPANNPVTPKTNDGGTTIGSILTSNYSSTGVTGTTKFESIMAKLVQDTQSYFDVITNQSKTLVDSYNRYTMEMVGKDRDYTDGDTFGQNAPIYGKPTNVEEKITETTNQIKQSIDIGTNPIINYLAGKGFNFISDTQLNNLKSYMKNYVDEYSQEYSTGVFETIQKTVNVQQNYVQNIRKLNFVCNGLIDGKVENDGDGIIYNLSPLPATNSDQNYTNTQQELEGDFKIVGSGLTDYIQYITTEKIITDTYTTPGALNNEEFLFYKLMAQVIIDKNKLDNFKNSVIKGDLVNYNKPRSLSKEFDNICNDLRDKFLKLHKQEKVYIDDLIKSKGYSNYKKYSPFSKQKERKFNFDSNPLGTQQQINNLVALYKTGNVNNDKKTYLGKVKFD